MTRKLKAVEPEKVMTLENEPVRVIGAKKEFEALAHPATATNPDRCKCTHLAGSHDGVDGHCRIESSMMGKCDCVAFRAEESACE